MKILLCADTTTAMASKVGFTLASAATVVVEFMAKWSNFFLLTVFSFSKVKKVALG